MPAPMFSFGFIRFTEPLIEEKYNNLLILAYIIFYLSILTKVVKWAKIFKTEKSIRNTISQAN